MAESPALKLRHAVTSTVGPASAEYGADSKAHPAAVLFPVSAGDSAAFILLRAAPGEGGEIQLSAQRVMLDGQTILAAGEEISLSAGPIGIAATELNLHVQQTARILATAVEIGGLSGNIGFKKRTTIGSLLTLLLKAKYLIASGKQMIFQASFIHLNSVSGRLGHAGQPIARMGDRVTGVDSHGGPITAVIAGGSGQWSCS